MPTADSHRDVETLLRDGAAATAADWGAVRARFAARASSEGLVDVAFEDHDTPLGTMRVSATATGIVRMILPAEDAEEVLEDLARKVSARIVRISTPAITVARRELDEYFNGARRAFDVPLDWTLTKAFRRKVLQATAQIPYGQTSTYTRSLRGSWWAPARAGRARRSADTSAIADTQPGSASSIRRTPRSSRGTRTTTRRQRPARRPGSKASGGLASSPPFSWASSIG